MRPVVTNVHVAWSVWLLDTSMSPAKTVEPIDMPFEVLTRLGTRYGAWNPHENGHVLAAHSWAYAIRGRRGGSGDATTRYCSRSNLLTLQKKQNALSTVLLHCSLWHPVWYRFVLRWAAALPSQQVDPAAYSRRLASRRHRLHQDQRRSTRTWRRRTGMTFGIRTCSASLLSHV